jgi:4'-phosphopantetheinyl transferase
MVFWYYNINDFPSEAIDAVLQSFPEKIADEIKRYRIENDRKSRLIARLLVQKYVLEKTNSWNWENWKKQENHKPKIELGPFFNISHSGNMVIVGFSEKSEVGVDIEEIKEIDVASMVNHFHPDEIEYLKKNRNDKELFYMIWTKKEAFLKACGTGIVMGLDQVSVLTDRLFYEGNWHVKNIDIVPDYKCAICSTDELDEYTIIHIEPGVLTTFIREKIFR